MLNIECEMLSIEINMLYAPPTLFSRFLFLGLDKITSKMSADMMEDFLKNLSDQVWNSSHIKETVSLHFKVFLVFFFLCILFTPGAARYQKISA